VSRLRGGRVARNQRLEGRATNVGVGEKVSNEGGGTYTFSTQFNPEGGGLLSGFKEKGYYAVLRSARDCTSDVAIRRHWKKKEN